MKSMGIDIGHCGSAAAYPEFRTDDDNKNSCKTSIIEGANYHKTITTQMLLTDAQLEALKEHELLKKQEALEQKEEIEKLRQQAGSEYADSLGSTDELELNIDSGSYPDYSFLKTLGEIKIGEDVPVEAIDGRAFRYFKIIPEKFGEPFGESPEDQKKLGIRHGTLMACFCYALLNDYITYGQKFAEADRENLKLIVGCPATENWTSDIAKLTYATLIKNATGVAQVKIVPESRGALFGIANEKCSISVADGVIVFDFGSLTADCTYLLSGKRLAEFSWQLGASSIEKEMSKLALDTVENKCRNNGIVPRFDDNVRIRTYRELREKKENHFKGKYPKGEPYTVMFDCDDGETGAEPVIINRKFMDEVIYRKNITIDCGNYEEKTGSWAELCEEFFIAAKERIINMENLPVKAIVLTGGASRMDFIAEKCKKVFGLEPIWDENVEYAVAQGLAWVSASEEKLPGFFEKAMKDLKEINSLLPGSHCFNVTKALTDYILSAIMQEVEKWANGDEDASIEDLNEKCNIFFSSKSNEENIKKVITAQNDLWKEKINNQIVNVVNKYTKELFTEDITNRISYNQIELNISFNMDKWDISHLVNSIDIDSLVMKTIKKIGDILEIILFFGTCGIWGFIRDTIDDKNRWKNIEKAEEKRKIKFDKNKRQSILSGLKSKKENRKIESEIYSMINRNLSSQFEKDETNFNNVLKESVEKAFRVAMLMEFEKTGWSD